jgi:hypothetical protein
MVFRIAIVLLLVGDIKWYVLSFVWDGVWESKKQAWYDEYCLVGLGND